MSGERVILVDGECVFCNRLVAYVLRRDREAKFRFAHVQSSYGQAVLARHPAQDAGIDGVYLLLDASTASEKLLVDGHAAREIWPAISRLGVLMKVVPMFLLNAYYWAFARVRYRLFGKYDACYVPTGPERARMIE